MVSELEKESQGERQTDRQPGSLCSWESAKMGGVCVAQCSNSVSENTTNSMLDNGVTYKNVFMEYAVVIGHLLERGKY